MVRRAGSAVIATSLNEAGYKGSQQTLKTGEFLQDDQHKSFNSSFKWGVPDDVAGYLAPLGWRLGEKGLATIEDAHEVCRKMPLSRSVCLSMSDGPLVKGCNRTMAFPVAGSQNGHGQHSPMLRQALGVTAWRNPHMEAEQEHNKALFGPNKYYIMRAQLLPDEAPEAARSA